MNSETLRRTLRQIDMLGLAFFLLMLAGFLLQAIPETKSPGSFIMFGSMACLGISSITGIVLYRRSTRR